MKKDFKKNKIYIWVIDEKFLKLTRIDDGFCWSMLEDTKKIKKRLNTFDDAIIWCKDFHYEQSSSLYVCDTFQEFINEYNDDVVFDTDLQTHLNYMLGLDHLCKEHDLTISQIVKIIEKRSLKIEDVGNIGDLESIIIMDSV